MLCYFQYYKILEKKTKNVSVNGWWIRTKESYYEFVYKACENKNI